MSELIDVAVPDIGDFDAVEVIEVLVSVGDLVEVEQALLTLESDKASMEIPSSSAGVVEEILVNIGDSVSEGSVVVRLKADASKPANTSALEPEAVSAGADAVIDIHVPDIGDFDSVEVIEVNVVVGDTVEEEQSLITLESDKASMEIPSTTAGIVKELRVAVGDDVKQGDLIVIVSGKASAPAVHVKQIAEGAETPKKATTPDPEPNKTEKTNTPAASVYVSKPSGQIHASPAVRKFARELGVDLSGVKTASGPKGRLLKDDIVGHVKNILTGVQTPASSGGSGIPPKIGRAHV